MLPYTKKCFHNTKNTFIIIDILHSEWNEESIFILKSVHSSLRKKSCGITFFLSVN